MYLIIIGNIISFIAAIFTAMSAWTTKKDKVYIYQAWQCGLLALASIFFQSWAGITTLLLCAVRNILIAKNRFTKPACYAFILVSVVLALTVNNRGAVGWILIIAIITYTLGCYYLNNPMYIKINIFINLSLWIIYEIFVYDFVSLITDAIALVVLIVSMIKLLIEKFRSTDSDLEDTCKSGQ